MPAGSTLSMTMSGMPMTVSVVLMLICLAMAGTRLLAWNGMPGAKTRYVHKPVFPWRHKSTLILATIRLLSVGFFGLIIVAGLAGIQAPQYNFATVMTWMLWWTGVILLVAVAGTAWCAICPWDALSQWLVNGKNRLQIRVPARLRNIWPAVIMLIVLTWLELGYGLAADPYGTAQLALGILVLTVFSTVVFERKAFCRYFCAVGRTLGVYSLMSPMSYGPVNQYQCNRCRHLSCYYGNRTTPPCPTSLVMGRIKDAMYCLSCGACAKSCKDNNVAWGIKPIDQTLRQAIHLRWDMACFIAALTAITGFHGLSMSPVYEAAIHRLDGFFGELGGPTLSFTFLMLAVLSLYMTAFILTGHWIRRSGGGRKSLKTAVAALTVAVLPLTFSFHLGHNITHLIMDPVNVTQTLSDPFGRAIVETAAPAQNFFHIRMAIQGGLLLAGFWLFLRIAPVQLSRVLDDFNHRDLLPALTLAVAITAVHLWLLAQPMTMRMS